MPKEKINHLTERIYWTPQPDEEGPGAWISDSGEPADTIVSDAQVQVGWHKDSYVQVSIEGHVSFFRYAAENPDGDASDRSTVYSPPLSRDEVNKMIRTLRRARDQVFGKDE